jgi:hypothetical protein
MGRPCFKITKQNKTPKIKSRQMLILTFKFYISEEINCGHYSEIMQNSWSGSKGGASKYVTEYLTYLYSQSVSSAVKLCLMDVILYGLCENCQHLDSTLKVFLI